MKKILFTLLLIATSFVAQAQNTITVRYFSQDDVRYAVAYAENDNEQCVDNADLQQVFSWNSTTNILSIEGNALNPFTNASDISFWNGVFERSSLLVVAAGSANQALGAPIAGVTFN